MDIAAATTETTKTSEDDDDHDEDGERDDHDEDDDNDGHHDDEDEDDDNDGHHDSEDEDDDNDRIRDDVDHKSTRQSQRSSNGSLAAGEHTDYTMVGDGGTLPMVGLVESPGAQFLSVEIYDPDGLLVATSTPTPGRTLATTPGLAAGHLHGTRPQHRNRANHLHSQADHERAVVS